MVRIIEACAFVIGGSFILFALVWLVAAFFTKRTVRNGSAWTRVLFAIMALAVWAVIRAGARGWMGATRLWPQTVGFAVTAAGITLLGLAFAFWARFTLGRNWSSLAVVKEGHELVQTGPYGLVRHPIYTGIITMVLGAAVFFGQAVVLVALMTTAVVFFGKARAEERLMEQTFPGQYADYRRRVKAIIPFLL